MPDIAGEPETLPSNKVLLQSNAHQTAVVRNAIERAKFVRAHIVTCGNMTAEILEAFPALRAREAILIEPGVNVRNRMKLTSAKMKLVNGLLSVCLNDIGAPVLFSGLREFLVP